MRPLTEALLAAVCELEGDVSPQVREALAKWYGPGSGWARGDRPGFTAHSEACPDWDEELGGARCDCCWREDCRPGGTTLLREVCCILWPWAADAIRRRAATDDGDTPW